MSGQSIAHISNQIVKYNEYMGRGAMHVYEVSDGWYRLTINDVEITQNDAENILDRIKQINRENGLSMLEA